MFDAKIFLEALDEFEATKGISKESVLIALKEAMEKGFRKQLGGDDALVRVNIDAEKATIEMAQIKMVVAEVEDDFLEISKEDAEKDGGHYEIGDEYLIPVSIDQLRKATAMSIKSVLRQKIAEAEKEILYNTYQDKIGEMITGKVEKVEENGITVNIGKTSCYVPRKDLIGEERFNPGDTIKLYVSDVASGTKGAHIVLSRSNEGFLKRLFEEEIREIYDGTIIIKAIARRASERSKVAVYTNDPNVDPAGACIGPNGSRIQRIVSQLGNISNKEKIDIIAWSENIGLYIMEALKPAQVVGISLNKEKRSAIAIVKDGTLSLAIGRRGVNVLLAVKLTGYSIDIKEISTALEEGIEYQSFEEIEKIAMEEKEAKARLASVTPSETESSLSSDYVAPSERVYDDETISVEEREIIEDELDSLEDKPAESTPVASTPSEVKPAEEAKPVEEVKPAEEVKPVETKPVEEITPVEVKTTTTLESLEKSLAEESKKNKGTGKKSYGKKKSAKAEEEKEEDVIKPVDTSSYMSIYTDEELAEFEKEDEEDESISDDYDDYDEYDSYYDDDDK